MANEGEGEGEGESIPVKGGWTQAESAKRFFENGDFADLTIVCQGQEWKVHKFQVCGQSEVLHKMCTGSFKEAKESKINLDDNDPTVVGAMLYYMYHGTYNEADTADAFTPMLMAIEMHAIAHKYFIEPLEKLACDKFGKHCEHDWESVEFADAVEEIYSKSLTETPVKDIAVKTIKDHAKAILMHQDEYKAINQAIRNTPALGADVLCDLAATGYDFNEGRSSGENITDHYRRTFDCPECGETFTRNIPLGEDCELSCVNGCYYRQSYGWSAQYKSRYDDNT